MPHPPATRLPVAPPQHQLDGGDDADVGRARSVQQAGADDREERDGRSLVAWDHSSAAREQDIRVGRALDHPLGRLGKPQSRRWPVGGGEQQGVRRAGRSVRREVEPLVGGGSSEVRSERLGGGGVRDGHRDERVGVSRPAAADHDGLLLCRPLFRPLGARDHGDDDRRDGRVLLPARHREGVGLSAGAARAPDAAELAAANGRGGSRPLVERQLPQGWAASVAAAESVRGGEGRGEEQHVDGGELADGTTASPPSPRDEERRAAEGTTRGRPCHRVHLHPGRDSQDRVVSGAFLLHVGRQILKGEQPAGAHRVLRRSPGRGGWPTVDGCHGETPGSRLSGDELDRSSRGWERERRRRLPETDETVGRGDQSGSSDQMELDQDPAAAEQELQGGVRPGAGEVQVPLARGEIRHQLRDQGAAGFEVVVHGVEIPEDGEDGDQGHSKEQRLDGEAEQAGGHFERFDSEREDEEQVFRRRCVDRVDDAVNDTDDDDDDDDNNNDGGDCDDDDGNDDDNNDDDDDDDGASNNSNSNCRTDDDTDNGNDDDSDLVVDNNGNTNAHDNDYDDYDDYDGYDHDNDDDDGGGDGDDDDDNDDDLDNADSNTNVDTDADSDVNDRNDDNIDTDADVDAHLDATNLAEGSGEWEATVAGVAEIGKLVDGEQEEQGERKGEAEDSEHRLERPDGEHNQLCHHRGQRRRGDAASSDVLPDAAGKAARAGDPDDAAAAEEGLPDHVGEVLVAERLARPLPREQVAGRGDNALPRGDSLGDAVSKVEDHPGRGGDHSLGGAGVASVRGAGGGAEQEQPGGKVSEQDERQEQREPRDVHLAAEVAEGAIPADDTRHADQLPTR